MSQQEHEQQERRWNSTELYHGINHYRSVRALQQKSPVSIFFVVMFLVGVHMSLSNIRHSVSVLSFTTTNNEYVIYMDNAATNERPKLLPPYESGHKSFGANTTAVNNGRDRNKTFGNKLQEMNSNMVVYNKSEFLEDNPKRNSASAQMQKKTSISNSNKSDDGKYKKKLEVMLSEDSTKTSPQSSILSLIPNANNTLITLISMGRLVDTYLVERCIRSIRQRGLFTGIIIVFTDSIGYKRYQETIPPWDNRTIIIEGRDEDIHPREENTIETSSNHTEAQLKKYKQPTMVFKRFKTHHSKYIAEYPALSNSIRYVMYADVDNIIGNRLDTLFEDYAKLAAIKYEQAINFHRNVTSTTGYDVSEPAAKSKRTHDDGFGFISMFRDKHLRSKMHSGIIIYDLAFEAQCVDGWRNEMDTFWDVSDQSMFLRVLKDYDRYKCTVFDLPSHYMSFANKLIMTDGMNELHGTRGKRRKALQYPTFVHVTNYRVKRLNNVTIHNDFIRHILKLKENEMMTTNISWDDVVSPMSRRKNTR